MITTQLSPARQANARKRRNAYRDLAIEYYARNASSVLAITHRRWPTQPWTSQPELTQIISAEIGWELDYRSLSRQLRRVQPFDYAVRQRVFELLAQPALYAPDFQWTAFCGRWNWTSQPKSVSLHQN